MAEETVVPKDIAEEIARWEAARQNLGEEYLAYFVKVIADQLENIQPQSDTEELLQVTLELVAEMRRLRTENKHLRERLSQFGE